MEKICDFSTCTGCRACEQSCPKKAITFREDIKGFLYPVINQELCIDCGVCKKNCVVHEQHKWDEKGEVYACWNRNRKMRRESTSGGVFRLLGEKMLKQGGVVYGAAFDQNFVVRHKRIDNIKELPVLLGSKYVQSDLGSVYLDVKKDLEDGKGVLFSGVPCQVAGLKNYLKKEYDNLLCVDILCHGVPSPLVFRDYLQYMQKCYQSKIKKINFRYKKPGWTVFSMRIDFVSGKKYIRSKFRDPFLGFFSVGGEI